MGKVLIDVLLISKGHIFHSNTDSIIIFWVDEVLVRSPNTTQTIFLYNQ